MTEEHWKAFGIIVIAIAIFAGFLSVGKCSRDMGVFGYGVSDVH